MIQPKPYRFSVDMFQRLGRLGVWPPDARLELLDGEIFDMAPIGPEHVYSVLSLQEIFFRTFGERVVVLSQSPIFLSEHAEPQPDLALLEPPRRRYQTRLARPEEVQLVVEVADTSLTYDRTRKLPLYARAGISEVWLLNLGARQLEVYRRPQGERYGELRTLSEGESVSPLLLEADVAWWL